MTNEKPQKNERIIKNPKIIVQTIDNLTPRQVMHIFALRFHVFVQEQQSIYDEFDGIDADATHVFIEDDGKIVVYARVFRKSADTAAFGRVAVDKAYRGQHFGRIIVAKAIEVAKQMDGVHRIVIEAQQYLQKFYESFGFQSTSVPYDDGGVMHIDMELRPSRH